MKRAGRGAWVMAAAVLGAMVLSTMPAFASGTADGRCDELMNDLRDGRFDAATAHFDSAVKAALTPQQLGAVWQGLAGANGKLVSWVISRRRSLKVHDIFVAMLISSRSSDLSSVLAVDYH